MCVRKCAWDVCISLSLSSRVPCCVGIMKRKKKIKGRARVGRESERNMLPRTHSCQVKKVLPRSRKCEMWGPYLARTFVPTPIPRLRPFGTVHCRSKFKSEQPATRRRCGTSICLEYPSFGTLPSLPFVQSWAWCWFPSVLFEPVSQLRSSTWWSDDSKWKKLGNFIPISYSKHKIIRTINWGPFNILK